MEVLLLTVDFISIGIFWSIATNCSRICRIWNKIRNSLALAGLQSCNPRKVDPLLWKKRYRSSKSLAMRKITYQQLDDRWMNGFLKEEVKLEASLYENNV